MEPGPLPPHERPWRHPSELGPPPHEPTSTTGRVLIVTSATVSLILIGLLAIAVTPDRAPAPIAASSTINELTSRSAPAAAIASSVALTSTTRPSLPVVTPLGDEGWAITTWEAVAGETGWMDARLPSGEVVKVEVVGADKAAGLVVVTLPPSAGTAGYELAANRPEPSDTVYVNSSQPKVVTLVDLAYLEVEEATPVLDGAGALIGLCTGGDDGTTLMTVDTMPGDDDGSAGPVDSTTPAVDTAAPETTANDSTATTETTTPDTGATDSSVVDETTVPATTLDSTDPESTVADSTVPESTTPPPPHGR